MQQLALITGLAILFVAAVVCVVLPFALMFNDATREQFKAREYYRQERERHNRRRAEREARAGANE